jgi:hypothetical protein
MADVTETKVENAPAPTEPAAAASSEAGGTAESPSVVALNAESADAAPAISTADSARDTIAAEAAPTSSAITGDPEPLASVRAAEPASSSPVADGVAAAAQTAAGAADAATLDVRPGFESEPRPEAGKSRTRFGKFIPTSRGLAIAASLVVACGLGLLIGSVGAVGIGHLFVASKAGAGKAAPSAETVALKKNIAQIEGQLAALKSSIDHAHKATISQTKGLTERYDRSARAQADLQARVTKIGETVDKLSKIGDNSDRLTKIGETVERLEKRLASAAANDVTGSVTPQRVASAPAPLPTPPMAEKKPPVLPVAEGWVIRDVFRGRALVANRHGVFEAAPGLELPGLGQVESIKQQDGRWVVITEKGLIVASRNPRYYYR